MTTHVSEQAKIHEEALRKREEELKLSPIRPADPSTWPKGVRSISYDEADALGVDGNGELYWHGKPVEIRRPLVLSFWQKFGAGVVGAFAIAGALGSVAQGWASYHDWACKTGYPTVACPKNETNTPPASMPPKG